MSELTPGQHPVLTIHGTELVIASALYFVIAALAVQ